MQLNEESQSAIKEIGNLCVAGGSNKISVFADDLVDISVVESETRSTQELLLELNPSDECKLFASIPLIGDVQGELLVQMSKDTVADMMAKFTKLSASQEGQNEHAGVLELVNEFASGFIEGMTGMTGLKINKGKNATMRTEFDTTTMPEQVLCYKSVIYVGDGHIDFNVFFFGDVNVIVPKVLASLGL